jgi:hypothetical protein
VDASGVKVRKLQNLVYKDGNMLFPGTSIKYSAIDVNDIHLLA